MGYGIQIDNGNGARQLDSDVINSIAVITSGTIATNGSITGVNLTTDLFFYNMPTTGLGNIVKSGTNTSATLTNLGSSVNYIRGKLATGLAPDSSGSYGVEIYNSSGQRMYSSNYSRESNILNIKPANTLYLGFQLGGGYGGNSAGSNNYDGNTSHFTSWPYRNGTTGAEPANWSTANGHSSYKFLYPRVIYSGDPEDVYVFAPPWQGSSTISGAAGFRTYTTWDYTNNEIGFSSTFHSSFTVPFLGTYIGRTAATNQCAIILMTRKG